MDGEFEEIRYISRNGKKRAGGPQQKKKKSALRRFAIISAVVMVSFFVLGIIILNSVTPVIVAIAEAKFKSFSTIAVNNAIFDVMTTDVKYNDLITITKDQNGSIRLISANTQLINKLAQDTARQANNYIAKIGEQGIGVPLGTMSGITAFTGKGPQINIKAEPSGSVVCEFVSEFEEAGINQTRHKIYLEVLTLIVLVLPSEKIEIYNTTQVLISENIIVGEVPDIFLKGVSLGGTLYDLVPG